MLTDNLKYCNDTLDLKKEIEGNFIYLAERLHTIKQHNLFEPQWSSFLEFCFEMRISQNMANKLMQIYEVFILGYGFKPEEITTVGGWGTLQEILPMVKTKKDAVHWMKEASILTVSDLRKNIREERTGIDMAKCKHSNSYVVRICKDCGDKIQEA